MNEFIRRVPSLMFAAATISSLWIPMPADASSCTVPFATLNSWLLNKPNGPGTYSINARYAANDGAGKYVIYGKGTVYDNSPISLTYIPAAAPSQRNFFQGYPSYLSATANNPAVEYFSDRTYSSGRSLFQYPFNPSATDNLGIQIFLQDAPFWRISAGQTTFTLLSWGNATSTMLGTCQNGILYGFIGTFIHTISLNESYVPVIPPPK